MSNVADSGNQDGKASDPACAACGVEPVPSEKLWFVPRTGSALAERWLCRPCLMVAFRSDAALDLAKREKIGLPERFRRNLLIPVTRSR